MPNAHIQQLRTIRAQLTDFRRRNVTAFLEIDGQAHRERAAAADAVMRAQERIETIDRMIADEEALASMKDASFTQIDA